LGDLQLEVPLGTKAGRARLPNGSITLSKVPTCLVPMSGLRQHARRDAVYRALC
jgi:hypothetical protein